MTLGTLTLGTLTLGTLTLGTLTLGTLTLGTLTLGLIEDDIAECPECNDIAKRQISKFNFKMFPACHVTDIQHENPPYVRNWQELTDALNRFNDTELASKQGKLAAL